MKLIELIMKHVPRDKIHPDAKFFTQDTCFGMRVLFQYLTVPKIRHVGKGGCWGGKAAGAKVYLPEAAEDANDTVVTREQLEHLWSLQDQGYTLVFGANPFTNPTGALVEIVPFNFFGPAQTLHALNVVWKNVIAYRPAHRLSIKNESRPSFEYYEPETTVAAAIEKRLSLDGDTKWPNGCDKICVDLNSGYLSPNGDNLVIITRKQWDDYISRKIRVGDKVTVSQGSTVHEVLFIGKDTAFLRAESGFEGAALLNILTRIPQ